MARVNIIIGLDGSISFVVAQGDFNSAKTAIQQAVEELKLAGVEFESLGDVEQHRHDNEHVNASVSTDA